jgi:hypothetical protein
MWHIPTRNPRPGKPWQTKSYLSVFALLFGLSGLSLLRLSSAQQPGAENPGQSALPNYKLLLLLGGALALLALILVGIIIWRVFRKK